MMKRWSVLILCLLPFLFADKLESALPTDSLTYYTEKKQKGLRGFLQRITSVDTNFIQPNHYHACAMLLGEKRFSTYTLRAHNAEGDEQELSFSPNVPFRVGPYMGFSLLFLGYTFDVGAKRSSISRSSLYLSLYTQFVGIDFFYEADGNNYQLKKLKGFDNIDFNQLQDLSFSGMSTYFMNLHIYYLFNHQHFSYPAAYSQSTVQKRSTGGFILGFDYTHEKINFDYTLLPKQLLQDSQGREQLLEEMKVGNVYYRDYSVSAGYGYNWVFKKNFLINLTLTPTLGYNFSKGEKFNVQEKLFDLDALKFDFISRASLVWNNSRYFAGIAVVSHTYSYKKPTFSINNSLITTSAYIGFNFLKKKKYK